MTGRVLVAGATGSAGTALLHVLGERSLAVRALARDPSRIRGPADERVRGDLLGPAPLDAACRDVDVIVSSAGAPVMPAPGLDRRGYAGVDLAGNRRLLEAARRCGVARFVYLSVWNDAATRELAYVRAHEDFADELRGSGLGWAVVRPTGFFSAFSVFLRMARRGVAPLVGPGTARTNPVHEADVARALADLLEGPDTAIDIGGPEVLSRRRIVELAFEACGRRPRIVRTPAALTSALGPLVGLWDRRGAELLAFLARVSTVDVIAPATGTLRLADYFEARVRESPTR